MVSSPRSAPRKRQPLQRSRQAQAQAPPSIWRRMLSWVARSEDDGRPPADAEQEYDDAPDAGEAKLNEDAEAGERSTADRVPRRMWYKPNTVDDGAERDEVEGDGCGNRRADEAKADGLGTPYYG